MAEGGNDMESTLTKSSSPGVPLKVILLGVKGVGKTSLFRYIFRFLKKDLSDEDCTKIKDSDFTHRIAVDDGRTVQMCLWDTAGMEGNRHEKNMTRSYYIGAQVALLVYSADDWESVEDLKDYVEDVQSHAPGAKKLLIRNKVDLPTADQTVNEQEVDSMFRKLGPSYVPIRKLKTSALMGAGIKTLLNDVGEQLLRQSSMKTDQKSSFQVYKPKPKPKPKEHSSCC